MTTIVATKMTGSGQRTMTESTLNGTSDTFTYVRDREPVLILRNDSGAPISPVIAGASATTVAVAGVGAVDVSSGYAVGSIADGAVKAIPLQSIEKYLTGAIAITSGSGLTCSLLEFK